MSITRRFLGWDRPVLELVAEDLLAATSPPILDLSPLLVVVPTRNAGRRLREMLANLAADQGRAISPPLVVPPEFLLSLISQPATGRTATPAEAILAWAATLRQANLDEFPTLYPVPPVSQDFTWALHTGRSLTELRNTLGETGLSIGDVSTLLEGNLEEEERWLELAALERLYETTLADRGLSDALAVRRQRAAAPDLPRGITGVRVAACPDPLPLALTVLKALSNLVPVEILVHAPADRAADFDSWGRPQLKTWPGHRLEFPNGEFPVHVLPNPEAQAQFAARAVLASPEPAATVTIGVLDAEVAGPLERLLDESDYPAFNPGGSPLRSEGILHLLRVLRKLIDEESFHAFQELLRAPDAAACLKRNLLLWDESPRLFEDLDQLYREHLFSSLSAFRGFLRASRFAKYLEILDEVERWLDQLRRPPLTASIREVLQDVFGSRLPHAENRTDGVYRAFGDAVFAVLDALEGPMGAGLDLSTPEILDLILASLEHGTLYEDRPPGSVELLGWLELHWDDAPHLIVTGFNEGFAPESITGDIYLPERLRQRIAEHRGFPTNESRLARDIYLLTALVESRRKTGRIDLCAAKHRQNGDPLRPSRLLFLCPDEELPSRIKRLFHDSPPPEPDLSWSPGFLLRPFPGSPPPFDPAELRVTAFQTYLRSPFDFYLEHVERMSPVDGDLREMDALAFGNFCHEVLRLFGADPAIREETNPEAIREFLLATADRLAREQFGAHPLLPVQLQIDTAKQRLAAAASIQAQTRAEGWAILATEVKLDDSALAISGVRIRGRIDRIDRHVRTGAIRVLDYKTGDRASTPESAHLVATREGKTRDWLPAYALVEIESKLHRWKDLQLPLYRLGLAGTYGSQIECGYFNLPKATAETAIQIWETLDETHDQAALRCAEGIIGDIRSGRFWPCPASAPGDSFHRLHLGLPDRTIDFASLEPAS